MKSVVARTLRITGDPTLLDRFSEPVITSEPKGRMVIPRQSIQKRNPI